MTYTPTKPFALALDAARNAIAGSTTFQTLVGAANAAAALTYVHIFEADGQAAASRAIVDWDAPVKEFVATGTFRDSGRIVVTIEAIVDETGGDKTRPECALWMADQAESIADEMWALGQAGGSYLFWRRLSEIEIGPLRASEGNEVFEEKLWAARFTLEFP